MNAVWIGKAVPVNQKSTLGKRRTASGLQTTIRTTGAYQKFIDDMAMCFTCLPHLEDKYCNVLIRCRLGPRSDSDGILKPVFDALQRGGVITNDFQIRSYSVNASIGKRREESIIIVEISELLWDPTEGFWSPQEEE